PRPPRSLPPFPTRRSSDLELAACRLERGRPVATFHRYLRNTVPVGESERVHRLSDQFLSEHGENPAQVLEDFASFAQGSLLAGQDRKSTRLNSSHVKISYA